MVGYDRQSWITCSRNFKTRLLQDWEDIKKTLFCDLEIEDIWEKLLEDLACLYAYCNQNHDIVEL